MQIWLQSKVVKLLSNLWKSVSFKLKEEDEILFTLFKKVFLWHYDKK